MKRNLSSFIICVGILAACSTGQKTEVLPQVIPQVPTITEVPHPSGYDMGDLRHLFLDQRAPTLASLTGCDSNFEKLMNATQSVEERTAGIAELVKSDPVGYHWCFYGKIIQLEEQLKGDQYIDQKQKDVLKVYDFLVPVAHSYLALFDDSRYLRWAVRNYRKLSDYVFYRRLELTPSMTSQLVDAEDPIPEKALSPDSVSVLAKYKINQIPAQNPDTPDVLGTPTAPDETIFREPASTLPRLEEDAPAVMPPFSLIPPTAPPELVPPLVLPMQNNVPKP